MKDILIVGGGFAGLSCAIEAHKRGLSFDLIDNAYKQASTRIAAGIMNPITGRKYQVQEQFDILHTAAVEAYQYVEKQTGKIIIHPLPIYKIHKSEAALEAWLQAQQAQSVAPYIHMSTTTASWQKNVDYRYGHLFITGGARIDTNQLYAAIDAINGIITEPFMYADLELKGDYSLYKDKKYKHIIFCEGYRVTTNPWFNHIHIRPSKGECMLVHIPHFQCPVIIQKHTFIVPYGNDRYWVGGTNDFVAEDDTPTQEKHTELIAALQDTIRLSFTVESHTAAIRPTMRDRRPAVGTHLKHPTLHILNGLGTKGALLGPYHAQMLFNTIFNSLPVDPKVDVQRFAS